MGVHINLLEMHNFHMHSMELVQKQFIWVRIFLLVLTYQLYFYSYMDTMLQTRIYIQMRNSNENIVIKNKELKWILEYKQVDISCDDMLMR
jgi:hypothetical protein